MEYAGKRESMFKRENTNRHRQKDTTYTKSCDVAQESSEEASYPEKYLHRN